MNNEGFPRRPIDEDVAARICDKVSSQRSLFSDIAYCCHNKVSPIK